MDWLLAVAVEARGKGIRVATWCDGVLVLLHPKHAQVGKTGDLGIHVEPRKERGQGGHGQIKDAS
jgi:hypothetical protein